MIFLPCLHRCWQSMVSIVVIIIVVFEQSCSAKHGRFCVPSSCGKIGNISYPFRLKGDPRGCGHQKYELDCVNNVTLFTLFSGKYHVLDINYRKYEIRLVDAGVAEDTCSIPRYFLYSGNFSSFDGSVSYTTDPLEWSYMRENFRDMWDSKPIIAFLNCTNPVTDDPRYVEMDTGRCDSRGYMYLVPASYFSIGDIKVGCYLKVATFANDSTLDSDARNLSYADIHKGLLHGFSLSWFLPVICGDLCGKGVACSQNNTTGQVKCEPQQICHYAYRFTAKCGIAPKALKAVLAYIRGYLKGFRIGLLSGPPFSTVFDDNGQYFGVAVYITRYMLPGFIAAKYIFGVTLLLGVLIYKCQRRHLSVFENIENFLLDNNLNPISYKYNEIRKMTKGFKVKLGQGGFGSVYKGKLQSGPNVAIKMLNKSKTNGQEFINEVATIGRIHHNNVVRLLGYCVGKEKHALVYEYMSNGSLDKYIFSKEESISLNYEKTHEICLGIAQGIAYLHQGCDVQILHFDIKPHNILLDDNFVSKISDFGLAKLYPINDSIVTLTDARGTLGYMAPELFYRNVGRVSYKADVYSFGMLLMEMTSRRKNSNPLAKHSSQQYFPLWIFDQLNEKMDIEMDDVLGEDKILAKKMFIIALWCIQLKPSDRPSMNKVIEMLEGKIENLIMPQRPSFYPHEMSTDKALIDSGEMPSTDFTNSDTCVGEPSEGN